MGELERAIAELSRTGRSPEEGLFGPSSMMWRIDRELLILLGGGRALWLQLAHPAVAEGVASFSGYEQDPFGRSRRTFEAMYTITFGTTDEAIQTGARIRDRHLSVRGTVAQDTPSPCAGRPYSASDPDLLFWVLATLIDTSLAVYERAFGRLTDIEREQFYQEHRRASALYGIPPEVPPRTYAAFQAYMRTMLEGPTLRVGPRARTLIASLREQPPSAYVTGVLGMATFPGLHRLDRGRIRGTISGWLDRITADLLPLRLRGELGLQLSVRDAQNVSRLYQVLGRILPRLPDRARFSPYYLSARARLGVAR